MAGAVRHLSFVLPALLALGPAPAAAQSSPTPGESTFFVMQNGVRVGTERVVLTRSTGGWLISATGQLAPPFNVQTNKFEVRYATDWQPQSIIIEAVVNGQVLLLNTSFGLTTAVSDVVQGGQKASATRDVSPRTIALPSNFFAGYEALAAWLGSAEVGTRLPVFLAPNAEVGATVQKITPRFMTTPDGNVDIRQFDLTLATPSGPLGLEVWVDAASRLARVVVPATGVAAVRSDLASVMAREEKIRNPGDEDLFIPGNGFNIAATITKPSSVEKAPVVILVPGAGPEDRDYTLYGVSIFGRLAGALAEAGFFVIRYDKRGIGQSGGRVEKAGVSEYADDVKRIVQWVRKRKDVDDDRIAVIGHHEGAAVALRAADMEGRIKAIGLVSATGMTGYQATLADQDRELERSTMSEVDKQERRAMQQRVLDAAMSGGGWNAVPEDVRKQADTEWFRTWIAFDPARALDRTNKPVLIVHGELDREVPVEQATRLETLALDKKNRPVEKVVVPGVNHLLVPADTGEVDEYATVGSKALSPEVVSAIVNWLRSY
jgi:pimeloyl-ACP methyl ester carboxylesterase